jgi:hypothetical protein
MAPVKMLLQKKAADDRRPLSCIDRVNQWLAADIDASSKSKLE